MDANERKRLKKEAIIFIEEELHKYDTRMDEHIEECQDDELAEQIDERAKTVLDGWEQIKQIIE